MIQSTIFDILYSKYKITKPIRLIEFFAGYGSQALALKYLGVKFEHWKICEWAVKSIQAYKDIHFNSEHLTFNKERTKEEMVDYLYSKGISANYNEPMTREQINRLSEEQLKTIMENIAITHNLVNVQQVKGKDLEITDTDKYCYIFTYSFPCQDLSLAGKGKGMSDTSTRSGMLWEVERILTECKELGTLPQILLMENVPQVHGEGNTEDFNKWQLRLEELGYKNYWEDLIATDYGIPQTRNRCFMVSILGDYNYTFPPKQPLKLKLKDMLEDNVDESFYLSEKQIQDIQSWNAYEKPLENMEKIDKNNISSTLTTRSGAYAAGMILIKNANSKGYLEAKEGDGVDISSRMEYHRGTVQKGKSQTITTFGGENVGVVVDTTINKEISAYSPSEKELFTKDGNIKRYIGSEIVDKFEEGQMATTTYPNGYGHGPRTHNESVSLNTIDKPSVKHNLRIRKLTPKECFRLMGVKDEDYENCAKNQSNASLYHLAGDSIVVNVLMAIFKELM